MASVCCTLNSVAVAVGLLFFDRVEIFFGKLIELSIPRSVSPKGGITRKYE